MMPNKTSLISKGNYSCNKCYIMIGNIQRLNGRIIITYLASELINTQVCSAALRVLPPGVLQTE